MRALVLRFALGFAVLSPLALGGLALAQPRASSSGNDRLVERALDDLGGSYRQPGMRDAVRRAFDDLYPGYSWTGYRLSDTQARAVAYIALERAPRPAPWPPRTGDRPPLGQGSGACRDLDGRLYDLALAVPPDRFRLFLDDEEEARIRTDLTAVGRAAAACGCRPLADGALALVRRLDDAVSPRRSEIVEGLDRLRTLADDCR